jgi:hypothetical protein
VSEGESSVTSGDETSDPGAVVPIDADRQPAQAGKDRVVALLLAAAAVAAAILATWASFTTSSASSNWQAAVRAEIRRSTATVEDVRRTFGDDASLAYEITQAQVRGEEFLAAAEAATDPAIVAALEREAAIQAGVVETLLPSSEVAADPKYALPGGGYDLIQRLADSRARFPELLVIDPDVDQAAGDRLSHRATLIVATGIPVGITLMLGALAKAFGRFRRPLLAAGSAALGLAVIASFLIWFFA